MTKLVISILIFVTFQCTTFCSEIYNHSTDLNETRGSLRSYIGTNPGMIQPQLFDDYSIQNQTEDLENITRHHLFYECPQIELAPEEYVIKEGLAIIRPGNISINSSWYELEEGYLYICIPGWETTFTEFNESFDKYPTTLQYVNMVGMGLSSACLLLHLTAFVVVKDFRNLPGYNLAALCLSLLASYISSLVGRLRIVQESGVPCVAFGIALHFSLLASFLWMNAIAFDILKSLRNATGKLRVTQSKFKLRKLLIYSFYSWGMALVFVTVAVVFDQTEYIPIEFRPFYGQGICWIGQRKALFVFFAAPVFVLITLNVIFFGVSTHIVYANRMKGDEIRRNVLKKHLVTFSKLAIIMGLTWIVGIFAGAVNNMALWYVFVVLNVLQGLFIFVAFTLTEKVRKHLMDRLGFESK